jgi:hypothetical protein
MRCAVLSDDFGYLTVLKQDLQSAGHILGCTFGLTGDDPFPCIEEHRPQVIVACLRSTEVGPEWDSFTRVAEVLGGTIPLIICSAREELSYRHLSLHLLHATPLCAPYRQEELVEAISEAVAAHVERYAPPVFQYS